MRDRRAVVPVATISLAMVVSALPEFVLGALGPFIVSDLELSRTSFGMLASLYFVVGSALSVPAGAKADALPLRTTLTILFCFGLAALGVMSVAPTYPALAFALMLAGVAASASNPIGNAVIAKVVPASAQGLAMGIKQSGIQMAMLTAGIVLPPLAAVVGWRLAVLGLVPVGVAGLVLTWRGFPQAGDRTPRDEGREADTAVPLPTGLIAWLAAFAFLMGSGTSAVPAFVALFAFETVAVPAARAGTLTVALGVAGVVARVFWGHVVGRIGRPWRFLPYFAFGAAAATVVFAVSPRVGEPLLWVAAAMFGLGAMAWSPVVHLSLVRLLGAGASGRGSGGVQSAFFLGMIVSPNLFGVTVDRAGYVPAWLALTAVFLTAGVLSVTWLVRTRHDVEPSAAQPRSTG